MGEAGRESVHDGGRDLATHVDREAEGEPDGGGLDDARDPRHRAPPPGFDVRRPTDDDLPAITALYERAAVRSRHGTTGRGALRADDDLRRTWHERRDDALVVTVGDDTGRDEGLVVGYVEVHEALDPWTPELDVYAEGRVDPRADARLVGEFLLARARDRAARAAVREPTLPTVLRTTVVDPGPAVLPWFTERGLHPERHLLQLRIDLDGVPPAPAWPDGVHGAAATDVADAAVHDALVASFADHHLGATDDLEDWRAVRLRTGRVDLRASTVALDEDGAVVGVALGRVGAEDDPHLGIVTDLGVRPARRHDGIGAALLRAAFRRLASRGAARVGLEVDDVTLDGALRLYQRAGMEVLHHVWVLATDPLATDPDATDPDATGPDPTGPDPTNEQPGTAR